MSARRAVEVPGVVQGARVRVGADVRPARFAGRTGTVVALVTPGTGDEVEVGVQLGGALAWFRPEEVHPS